MRVLFATTVLPGARVTGSEVVSSSVIEAIESAGHEVRVLGYRRPRSAPAAVPRELCVGTRPIETSESGIRGPLWMLSALARRMPYSAEKYASAAYRRAIAGELRAWAPDAVVIDHAQMGWLLVRLPSGVPVIYLAHNVERDLYSGSSAGAGGPMRLVRAREARMIGRMELRLLASAARVWCLSRADADRLRTFEPAATIEALSVPGVEPPADAGGHEDRVGLLGTWTWEPNARGLRWFLDEVVPRLGAAAGVTVAGAGSEEVAAGHEGVRAVGRIDDAGRFLRESRTIAVPSVAGAGVQIKTLDAIASGRPVVATSIAMRGIDDRPANVRVADEPAEFAELLARADEGRGDDDPAVAAWAAARRERFEASIGDGLEAIGAERTEGNRDIRCAYLVSRYPYVSHTFVLREVLALRERGVAVETVTVRRSHPRDVIAPVDRRELETTHAILPAGAGRLLSAHLQAMRAGPRAFAATLLETLRDSPGGPRRTLWQFFYFVEGILLWRFLRERGVGHVHAHHGNVSADLAMVATRFGNRLGREPMSWSVTLHGPTEFGDVDGHKLGLKGSRADAVVATSAFVQARMHELLEPADRERVSVIHCGVDLDEYPAPQPRDTGAHGMRLLCVARLEARKGHAILLDAVAQIVRDGIAIELTIAGDGPERRALERRARKLGIHDRVHFLGALGHDEVGRLYERADAFCLASFHEGVPTVLMEAMASGVPVVATTIYGVPELVEDGESGLLVPAGSTEALAEALARLASDQELRDRLGAAGRLRVAQHFSLDGAAAQLERVFDRMPGAHGLEPVG